LTSFFAKPARTASDFRNTNSDMHVSRGTFVNKMQDARCKMQDARCKMQDAKCKMQNGNNGKQEK